MKRKSEENNHDNSPSPSRRLLYCPEISTVENSGDNNIPLDLAVEILKKLPGKSLVRFRCVSKQWSSIISYRRDFIDSIVTRSLTEPLPRDTHLIVKHHLEEYPYSFLSSAYNTNKESVTIPGRLHQYVRGLIYCWPGSHCAPFIYNPTTRQSLCLPEINPLFLNTCFFGYDPLENKYKLVAFHLSLCKTLFEQRSSCQVFTLGDPKVKQWRNIQCNIGLHHPSSVFPVCINGVIYYRARYTFNEPRFFLVGFDVRSEKFDHIKAPKTLDEDSTVINYQGKLGVLFFKNSMEIWVMEDGEKKTQEWSKIFSYVMVGFGKWRCSGVTSGGEIVFVNRRFLSHDKLYVLYYGPKQNYIRYVDIQGCYPEKIRREGSFEVQIVPDHVESTMCL